MLLGWSTGGTIQCVSDYIINIWWGGSEEDKKAISHRKAWEVDWFVDHHDH